VLVDLSGEFQRDDLGRGLLGLDLGVQSDIVVHAANGHQDPRWMQLAGGLGALHGLLVALGRGIDDQRQHQARLGRGLAFHPEPVQRLVDFVGIGVLKSDTHLHS